MRIVRPRGRPDRAVDALYEDVPLAVRSVFGRLPHIATVVVEPLGDVLAGEYQPEEFLVSVDAHQDAALSRWLRSPGDVTPEGAEAVSFALQVLLHESIHALWPDYDRAGTADGLAHTLSEGLTELTTEVFFDDFLAALGPRVDGLRGAGAPGRTYIALVAACRMVVERVCELTGAELRPKLRELAMWGFGSLDGALAAMSGELVDSLHLPPLAVLRRVRADHAIVEAVRGPLAALADWDTEHGDTAPEDEERIGRHHGARAVAALEAVLTEMAPHRRH